MLRRALRHLLKGRSVRSHISGSLWYEMKSSCMLLLRAFCSVPTGAGRHGPGVNGRWLAVTASGDVPLAGINGQEHSRVWHFPHVKFYLQTCADAACLPSSARMTSRVTHRNHFHYTQLLLDHRVIKTKLDPASPWGLAVYLAVRRLGRHNSPSTKEDRMSRRQQGSVYSPI